MLNVWNTAVFLQVSPMALGMEPTLSVVGTHLNLVWFPQSSHTSGLEQVVANTAASPEKSLRHVLFNRTFLFQNFKYKWLWHSWKFISNEYLIFQNFVAISEFSSSTEVLISHHCIEVNLISWRLINSLYLVNPLSSTIASLYEVKSYISEVSWSLVVLIILPVMRLNLTAQRLADH